MDYLDYAQLNVFAKARVRLAEGVRRLPQTVGGFFRGIGRGFRACCRTVGRPFREAGTAFRQGDWRTRLSFLFMGFGCLTRGQIVKGLAYLAAEVLFIAYMAGFGWQYLRDILTLGTQTRRQVWNEDLQIFEYEQGDNSMLILLFSVLSIVIALVFLALYIGSVRAALRAQRTVAAGGRPPRFRQDVRALLNERFHVTMLVMPSLFIFAFIVLPLLFMVLLAFTNFDKSHQPPGNLFTWIGTANFQDIFWQDPLKSYTFGNLLVWTLTWAVIATFSNYIFGMVLALMINKKGIRGKKVWRTIFVMTIAVPQFVSLLLMSQLLADQGAFNVLLQQLGLTHAPVPFLTDGNLARITVLVVNLWVGIPFTMLITTGILMNIPEDLYESARIDGAGPATTFWRITLPYMLFVTGPYLITQFVGNINNFNLIYLLTGGGPLTLDYYQAGKTDLLVTWLYKQTVNEQNYSLASTIGILVFLISGLFSLIVYNRSAAARKEEEFQ